MTGRPLNIESGDWILPIAAAPRIWFGTDFDGTLTEHVDDPFAVALTPEMRDGLTRLAACPAVDMAIVSGRSLADLMPRVGLEGIAYSGNHGLEINAPGLKCRDPIAEVARGQMNALKDQIERKIQPYAGSFVEDKFLTLEVHYRLSTDHSRSAIRAMLDELLGEAVTVRHTDFGSEIRPAGAGHKGTAARQLWNYQSGGKGIPLFLGDSLTDEDAFLELPDGFTVKVGPGPTAARFRVNSPRDVLHIMHRLTELFVERRSLV
ncbi:MAG: trehalose-phosphatase [Gemmataceae bacterium]